MWNKIKVAFWILFGIGSIVVLISASNLSRLEVAFFTFFFTFIFAINTMGMKLEKKYKFNPVESDGHYPDKDWLSCFVSINTIQKVKEIERNTYDSQHSIVEQAIDVYYGQQKDRLRTKD